MPTVKKVKAVKAVKAAKTPATPKVSVSEPNLRKAAARLLATKLVSAEVAYLQRELATSVTQEELDKQVLAVRKLPWASIVIPD
jgi:hypothetical protein